MDSSPLPNPSGPPSAPIAKTSGLAIASLVLGLIPFCIFTGIAGLICGFKARTKIRSSGGALTGDGLALAGIILSLVMIVSSLPVLAGMLVPAFAKARDRAETITSLNNLKAISVVQRAWTAENGDKMPPPAWTATLSRGGGLTNVSLSAFGGKVGYAYNIAVAGMDASQVPADTVVFFETDQARPDVCGGRDLLRRGRSRGARVCVVFSDGSALQVRPGKADSLRWNP